MHPLDLSPSACALPLRTNDHTHFTMTNLTAKAKENSNKLQISTKRERDSGKRGRPRADLLTTLMIEGSSSKSKIRCDKCGRAFPREKSLQAHLRTHTGERPYNCDFPGCSKAFCQSGQLKTHQRLHTGERPFVCAEEGCSVRFTHSNRHCSEHPHAGLIRLDLDLAQVAKRHEEETNAEIKRWLNKYIQQCKDRMCPKAPSKESLQEGNMRKSPSPTLLSAAITTRSLSLPRIPSVPSLTSGGLPPSPTFSSIKSSRLSLESRADTYMTWSPPRQCSALSTGSSSSGVSSISSTSSVPPSPPLRPNSPALGNFIYSSQMVLQGNDSEELRPASPADGATYLGLSSPPSGDSSPAHVHSPPPQSYQILNSKPAPPKPESTSSIYYRVTPKNREKDRYISALALIELSQR
ncbi:Krueppel homolog 1 [Aplysia californica]|uniref:Krueppel homolog 1 n=1 Tax=Aplysia californica TaxID=6500 RepID=A0ABM0JQB1_APLCA|nr:Krueppel homolog 1 [Aplysia californica]